MLNILKIVWEDGAEDFLNMNPKGDVLPCHAAETIPHLKFDNVREKSLKWIWENSEAFNLYRGTDWMPDPCKTCDRKRNRLGWV